MSIKDSNDSCVTQSLMRSRIITLGIKTLSIRTSSMTVDQYNETQKNDQA